MWGIVSLQDQNLGVKTIAKFWKKSNWTKEYSLKPKENGNKISREENAIS